MNETKRSEADAALDTSSRQEFVDYYTKESQSEATRHRFESIRVKVLQLFDRMGTLPSQLSVLDIGCGAGTQCLLWASAGHRVSGVDINAPLVDLARQRATEAGLTVDFRTGSATDLPFESESMDVCLMPELLEHVPDWQACVLESVRTLRPGGILYLSTTNRLCPIQQEFRLPLYSWYPAFLKRHYVKLATTTRPELVNHARYPAVHWFTYYELSGFLMATGLQCFDRFSMLDTRSRPVHVRMVALLLRNSSLLRFLGQICSSGTAVYAVKR